MFIFLRLELIFVCLIYIFSFYQILQLSLFHALYLDIFSRIIIDIFYVIHLQLLEKITEELFTVMINPINFIFDSRIHLTCAHKCRQLCVYTFRNYLKCKISNISLNNPLQTKKQEFNLKKNTINHKFIFSLRIIVKIFERKKKNVIFDILLVVLE